MKYIYNQRALLQLCSTSLPNLLSSRYVVVVSRIPCWLKMLGVVVSYIWGTIGWGRMPKWWQYFYNTSYIIMHDLNQRLNFQNRRGISFCRFHLLPAVDGNLDIRWGLSLHALPSQLTFPYPSLLPIVDRWFYALFCWCVMITGCGSDCTKSRVIWCCGIYFAFFSRLSSWLQMQNTGSLGWMCT